MHLRKPPMLNDLQSANTFPLLPLHVKWCLEDYQWLHLIIVHRYPSLSFIYFQWPKKGMECDHTSCNTHPHDQVPPRNCYIIPWLLSTDGSDHNHHRTTVCLYFDLKYTPVKFHDCTGYDALALAKKMTFQNLAEDSKQGAGRYRKIRFRSDSPSNSRPILPILITILFCMKTQDSFESQITKHVFY